MQVSYDFVTPLSRVYDASQTSSLTISSIRTFDGGIIVATEVVGGGVTMLSRIVTALSRHEREERKLRAQLRGAGHEIEQDIFGKIYYGLSLLARIKEFYEFLGEAAKTDDAGDFIFEFADRIKEILVLDDTFDRIKSLEVWEAQKAFLFKHAKDQVVRRVSAFYGMIGPKLNQIQHEKANVVSHFTAFIEALAKDAENKAPSLSDLAKFRFRKTLESLKKLTALYVEVTTLSMECLTN